MSPTEFSQIMDRFYTVATTAIVQTDGLIEKFVGDEVACIYVSGMAGKDYTRRAIEAARRILQATGHDNASGSWLSVGAGVHWGRAFVGVVGSAGVHQLTVLGDIPNTAARLASSAKAGEILISDAAYQESGLTLGELERRELELKGKAEPFAVRVLKVTPTAA
jgi:adenylate cyclase